MTRELAAAAAAGPMGLPPAGGPVGVNAAVRRSAEWSASSPVADGLGDKLARIVVQNLNVTPIAAGGSPDPNVLAAQLSNALRVRGS